MTSIHPTALAPDGLPAGIQVGAFAVLDEGCKVGAGSTVGEHATLGPGVALGEGVVVAAGAQLVSDVRVGDGVIIGQNAVLGGGAPVELGPGATVGTNATVMPGVTVGRGARIEPGAVVADLVPANAIVRGNPAIIGGYVSGAGSIQNGAVTSEQGLPSSGATNVPGVYLHPLTSASDLRGSLVAAEFTDLPFIPQRVFSVFDVPSEHIRGTHAHRQCEQLLVCLSGSVSCVVDDGENRDELLLEGPDSGLYMPPMIWGTQYKYSRGAVLLVFASLPYDADDYIRDYDEFHELVGAAQSPA